MRKSLLSLPRTRELEGGWQVRLLSAREEMEARQEAEALSQHEEDRALCANAALLARALLREDKAAFQDGREVLEKLTARQISLLAQQWGELDRACDPAPWDEEAVKQAKKAWSTRLMSAFSGACSRLLGRCPQRRGPGR